MLPVTDVPRAIEFYAMLGFRIGNTFTPDGESAPVWAWLHNDRAHVMVTRSDRAVDAGHSSVSIWLYTKDVVSAHARLRLQGIDVGELEFPFYNPRGEFHIHDPDGYAIHVAHAE